MRWSLGPWIALSLSIGCSDFVGTDTDGAAADAGSSSPASETSTIGGSDPTGATATTDTGTASTSTTGSASNPTDSTSTTMSAGSDTTDAPATSRGTDVAGSETTSNPTGCSNEMMDGDESDVDCGGSCPACEFGQGCGVGTDCGTGFCAPSSICGLQEPVVWLDALDDATLFSNADCNMSPPTDGQPVYCWTNKGSAGGLFLDDGQPNYREASDGVEFDNVTMFSDASIFEAALADVTVFVVQHEVDSRNSFDFNLNHPNEDGSRYSAHVPWGNSTRRVVFDIGGSGGGARVSTAPDVVAVDETHVFSFVNSAEEDQRIIFIDGSQEASEAGSRSSDADIVSVGNGNRAVLHEFRVYAPSPSGVQRRVIEGQLACRWDLRDELPATHPFYDADGASNADCPPEL